MSVTWENSAFVHVAGDVPVTLVPGYIRTLFIQVAWGTGLPEHPISADRLQLLRDNFKLEAWAWCQGFEVEKEAEWHAQKALELEAEIFVANMEENYDAHGNQGDPRFHLPDIYLTSLLPLIGSMQLGLTTTPKFGSDMTRWIEEGAIFMPQAFPLDNSATVEVVVEHAVDWGWPIDQIRPLVQTYQKDERWANVVKMNQEATSYGIGVVPYTIEQACLAEGGMEILAELEPSISRPNPEPEDEDWMRIIGSQHGITAAYNRIKTLDPGGCNPAFDPNNYMALPVDQLKAWDKLCRTLMILREDHDEMATNPDPH